MYYFLRKQTKKWFFFLPCQFPAGHGIEKELNTFAEDPVWQAELNSWAEPGIPGVGNTKLIEKGSCGFNSCFCKESHPEKKKGS